MIIKGSSYDADKGMRAPVSLRCPGCKQQAAMTSVGQVNDVLITNGNAAKCGLRYCPNQACRAIVFVAIDSLSKTVAAYPAERLDFDTTNIPAAVATAMEESVACHATGAYVAAAIMVRKTLEELCRDRAATGPNLKARLKDLSSKVILPSELLDGLDDLRLLGNDAAHIESLEFTRVGREEVEIGIDVAKEVLKAVYQYSALVSRLRALKK